MTGRGSRSLPHTHYIHTFYTFIYASADCSENYYQVKKFFILFLHLLPICYHETIFYNTRLFLLSDKIFLKKKFKYILQVQVSIKKTAYKFYTVFYSNFVLSLFSAFNRQHLVTSTIYLSFPPISLST